jgi:hypothetical protein
MKLSIQRWIGPLMPPCCQPCRMTTSRPELGCVRPTRAPAIRARWHQPSRSSWCTARTARARCATGTSGAGRGCRTRRSRMGRSPQRSAGHHDGDDDPGHDVGPDARPDTAFPRPAQGEGRDQDGRHQREPRPIDLRKRLVTHRRGGLSARGPSPDPRRRVRRRVAHPRVVGIFGRWFGLGRCTSADAANWS